MRLRQIAVPLALALLPLAFALPALADAGGTAASLVVLGGALVITVPDSVLTLAHGLSSVDGSRLSGLLGQVQVSDARGASAGAGWIVSVSSTAFAAPTGPSLAAAAVGYRAGPISTIGSATVTAHDPASLATLVHAVTATGISGQNSATWNPTITVGLPGSAAAGDYTGTITHSVT